MFLLISAMEDGNMLGAYLFVDISVQLRAVEIEVCSSCEAEVFHTFLFVDQWQILGKGRLGIVPVGKTKQGHDEASKNETELEAFKR